MKKELVITIDDSLMSAKTADDVEAIMYDAWAATRNYQETMTDPTQPWVDTSTPNPQTKKDFFCDGLISFLRAVVAEHTRRIALAAADENISSANDALAAAILPGITVDVRDV